ncbi:GTPase HflX [Candidatus Puniceispirillum marinum]|uniref:GTPase HflX n=1 Tax=Puniceispirillum marinum (strain IMCC1322) TaxID=488538 RepID=D5BRY9_PUNMI|nr:GTPase HflX [Candidatus Puniceispirillum marinum]ADE39036.1 GTPase [Candidatus Puniceispirillum marinum IMCC1322]
MGSNNAFVIHPDVKYAPTSRPADMMLEEACMLVEAIGLDVVVAETVNISQPRAGSFLGKGYADQLAEMAEAYDHPLIIINTTLSSVQQRNLETLTSCKVIDRTALILEIFGARAQTHAGRLQVELAALTFQRSRLVRSWTHLERQRGGGGFLGGPGERQIELDRRMLMDRVMRIKGELREVERTRHLQRRNRDRSETPTLALIGYTNAGKSTLFNMLTGADVLSKDMLFATLDPTMRGMKLPSGRRAVLADTVGFISQLPTELVEAFKSTLEEVVEADILVHVHDASSPMVAEEYADVCQILEELGLDAEMQAERVIHILNKSDKIDDMAGDMAGETREYLENLVGNGVFVSALTGAGIDDALLALDEKINIDDIRLDVMLAPEDGAPRAWLHAHGTVHNSLFDEAGNETVSLTMSIANRNRFQARWPHL